MAPLTTSRTSWLGRTLGVDPRTTAALLKSFVLMDLRGQFYAKATATKPRHIISPLFIVVGQCLTASAVSSLVLFMRVDVFFYAFIGLSLSMLVIATTVLVEFHEVVLNPDDLEILAHRPISPRTYTAARFGNLLFYVGLMYLALNIFPLLLGGALRDSGPWYVPAYLAASLFGNLVAVCAVIWVLSFAGRSQRLEQWKEVLAWTQIVAAFIAVYGAQLMFRGNRHALELWAAFPPDWIAYLPSTWLARFVAQTARSPSAQSLAVGTALAAGSLAVCAATVYRLSRLYQAMQPQAWNVRHISMAPGRLGTLSGPLSKWLLPVREERIGYWLGRVSLARDGSLRMRCLWPLNMVVAVVVLGVLTEQFANPMIAGEASLVMLPILSVYLVALSVPSIVYNLAFSEQCEASWLLRSSPLERPLDVACGMCKAVQLWIITPLCLTLGAVMGVAWGDLLAAALHAALAWALCWPMALASLWLVLPDLPLSLPAARGGTLGPIVLPMALLSAVTAILGALHYELAAYSWFYVITIVACLAASPLLNRLASSRLAGLARASV
jgi:hypothetical protein